MFAKNFGRLILKSHGIVFTRRGKDMLLILIVLVIAICVGRHWWYVEYGQYRWMFPGTKQHKEYEELASAWLALPQEERSKYGAADTGYGGFTQWCEIRKHQVKNAPKMINN